MNYSTKIITIVASLLVVLAGASIIHAQPVSAARAGVLTLVSDSGNQPRLNTIIKDWTRRNEAQRSLVK